jgi:dihydrofolate reductase
MGTVVLDISMSLDGFIAAPNGDDKGLHDWVFGGTIPVTTGGMTFHLTSDSSAEIFGELVQTAGAVVIGNRAFNVSGDNPPLQLPSFVLSHDAREMVVKQGTTITFVTDGIESALAQAKAAAGDKNVYVFGGANTAQQYIQAELLDEFQIHLVPILLGDGIRLFDQIGTEHIELESMRVIESPGVTHLRFRIVK